jgi:hypothetical protein
MISVKIMFYVIGVNKKKAGIGREENNNPEGLWIRGNKHELLRVHPLL